MTCGAGRRVLMALAACGMTVIAIDGPAVALASPGSTEECVAKRVAQGESRTVALAACLRDRPSTTVATTRPPAGDTSSAASSDDDGGTSPVLLVVVGVVGLVVGAAGAMVLTRRSPASGPGAAPTIAPAAGAAPLQPPVVQPAPPNDRAPALIGALIDLSDRMSSQALRSEIIATLGRAGVHPIEIAPGTPFEATTMRGIGSSPTSDTAWVGRVATTDRCGFHDAGRIIRLPDVVVYVAG